MACAKLRCQQKMLSNRIKLKTPPCNTWQRFNTINPPPPNPKNENVKYRRTSQRQETESGWNCTSSFSEQSQLRGCVERKRVGIKTFLSLFLRRSSKQTVPKLIDKVPNDCLHFQMQLQLSLQEYMVYSTKSTDAFELGARKLFHTLSFPHGASI